MSRRVLLVLAGLLLTSCGGGTTPPTPIAVVIEPPAIVCPVDLTVRGVPGPSLPIPYAAPAVTGGAAPITTTCTPASGDPFTLGSTPVSCAATDTQSRRATCSFNVTLTGITLGVAKYEAIGDSFTEGQNGLPEVQSPSFVDPPNSYPTKLQTLFNTTYPGQGIVVINRGFGGYTVERTVEELRDNLRRDNPGAVLVLTGYNDLLNGGCKVVDGTHPLCPGAIDDVIAGVRDSIRHSKEAPFHIPYVFVSTLTPSGPGPVPKGIIDRRIRPDVIVQTNARIKQVVAAEGAILVDTYPRFTGHEAEYVSLDGLHLLPPGNQAIADSFFAVIRATVPQAPLSFVNGLR